MLNPQMDSQENTIRLAKRYAKVLRDSHGLDISIYETDFLGLSDPAKQADFVSQKAKAPDQQSCSVVFTSIVPAAVAMTLAAASADIINPSLPSARHGQDRQLMRQSLSDVRSMIKSLCAGGDSGRMQMAIGAFLDQVDMDATQVASLVRAEKAEADRKALAGAGKGHLQPGEPKQPAGAVE